MENHYISRNYEEILEQKPKDRKSKFERVR